MDKRYFVVDFHTHGVCRDANMPESFRGYFSKLVPGNLDDFFAHYEEPANFLLMLDEAGVDAAIVMAETNPLTSAWVPNQFVADFCRGHERLIPVATVNPFLTSNLGQEVDRLAKMGFRGLKLYPTYQHFYINDPMIYPVYAKAQENGLFVMMHTGSSVFPAARIKYGEPVLIDDVAVDYPEVPLILCHAGRPFWYDQAYWMARLRPNVYLDLAGLPPRKLLEYIPEMARIADKLLFGTDWPQVDIGANWRAILDLPFSETTKAAILGRNAARLLGMKIE